MTYFRKILRFAAPYRAYALLNIFANVCYAFFSALAMVSLFPMLRVLFDNTNRLETRPEWQGIASAKDYAEAYLNFFVTQKAQQGVDDVLLFMVLLVMAMFLLKNIFNYLAMYFITFLRNGVLRDLRNALYKKTVALPLAHYSEKRKGDTIARITSDVLEIQHSFLSILELIVREPLTILFTIFAMLLISVKLTIFVFIFIPLSGFIISLIGKSLKRHSGRVQAEQGFFLSHLEETLGGLKVVKGFNAENRFADKFEESTSRFFRFSNKLLNRQNLAGPVSEFLGIAVIAVLLWYGGRMVLIDESLSAELFIVYMGLAYNILTPAKAISKASYRVKKGNAAAHRVLEILEAENVITDRPGAVEKQSFESEIALENVTFSYEDAAVIKDVSLRVPKGQTVALVGQSGSGKSTIANLITRFYDVQQGAVKMDGTDIKDITVRSLRNLTGLVTQEAILFNDTVKGNLLTGKPDATDKEIRKALETANALEFVEALPMGMDTNIGDSGNKLSGGQQQRLSIARAVLKNPPVMILDEATSALDTESERLVQDALENMMKNRTSVVIAHRLSTIQNADQIVVMYEGKIAEQGNHQELMEKNGVYKKLVSMQSFE